MPRSDRPGAVASPSGLRKSRRYVALPVMCCFSMAQRSASKAGAPSRSPAGVLNTNNKPTATNATANRGNIKARCLPRRDVPRRDVSADSRCGKPSGPPKNHYLEWARSLPRRPAHVKNLCVLYLTGGSRRRRSQHNWSPTRPQSRRRAGHPSLRSKLQRAGFGRLGYYAQAHQRAVERSCPQPKISKAVWWRWSRP